MRTRNSIRMNQETWDWLDKERKKEGRGKFIERIVAAYKASSSLHTFAQLGTEVEEIKKHFDIISNEMLPVFKALKRRSQIYGSIVEFQKIILEYRKKCGRIPEDTMFP